MKLGSYTWKRALSGSDVVDKHMLEKVESVSTDVKDAGTEYPVSFISLIERRLSAQPRALGHNPKSIARVQS